MKWRPLTEPRSGIIRCIDTKRVLSEEEIAVVLEGKFHKRNDELEWLDEAEECKPYLAIPHFDSWEDFADILDEVDDMISLLGYMAHHFPHGFKVGNKYIHK